MHREEGLDFSQVTTFNLDEYVGLTQQHPQSYHYFMHENLFKHINIAKQNIYIPSGTTDNYSGLLRVVRKADQGFRRHRPANPGHRLRRAHRLQRTEQLARLADAHQDAGSTDHRRQRPILRLARPGADLCHYDGRGHDPGSPQDHSFGQRHEKGGRGGGGRGRPRDQHDYRQRIAIAPRCDVHRRPGGGERA